MQIWKDVVGYQGKYQVSNLGRVKSLNFNNTGKEKIMKQEIFNNGYCMVHFRKKISKKKLVHRLVWQAFNGKIPQKLQVDHIDANKQNNRLDNLQLLTPSENVKKIYIDNPNYINKGGVKRRKIKCLNNDVIYNSIHQAGRKLNLDFRHISHVLNNKCKHHKGYRFIDFDENSINKSGQYIQEYLF